MLSRAYRFFTENWGLKLAALGLAVLLWMSVTASEPERAEFPNIPVEVELQDPEWRLEGPPQPENVTVTVEGPTASLVELSRQPLRIPLRVPRVNDTVESHVVPLQWVQQEIPPHLRQVIVRGLRPDTIQLRFERLESRTVPVQVRLSGQLPPGLALAIPINTNPGAVEVRGPASELAGLDSVPLFPVELSGLRSTTNVPVSVDTTLLEGLSFEPTEVNVVLRVTPDTVADTAGARVGAPF